MKKTKTTVKSIAPIALVTVAIAAAGCGGSSSNSSSNAGTTASTATGATTASTATAPAPAPVSEAQSTAQGDIPDNQVFLTYKNTAGGYSIKYPEGWARKGSGNGVTFQDKSNVVQITVAAGALPKSGTPVTLPGGPAIKTTLTEPGPADAVTGKTVSLNVDRYVLAKAGKIATVDLASPAGVDNVDAYRMMIESFRWL
jgi:hypothetical protein